MINELKETSPLLVPVAPARTGCFKKSRLISEKGFRDSALVLVKFEVSLLVAGVINDGRRYVVQFFDEETVTFRDESENKIHLEVRAYVLLANYEDAEVGEWGVSPEINYDVSNKVVSSGVKLYSGYLSQDDGMEWVVRTK